MPSIHSEFPETIAGTIWVYEAAKAYTDMCDKGHADTGYFPVDCNQYVLYQKDDDGVVQGFLIWDLDEEEQLISVTSAFVYENFRRKGVYTELFNELKWLRDRVFPKLEIYSEVFESNMEVMKGVLEKTGRKKLSSNWWC